MIPPGVVGGGRIPGGDDFLFAPLTDESIARAGRSGVSSVPSSMHARMICERLNSPAPPVPRHPQSTCTSLGGLYEPM